MNTVERGALFPSNDFSYPTGFSIARYKGFERSDRNFESANHNANGYVGNYGSSISPYQALARYAASPVGIWHSGQRARYPILHAELDPQLVGVSDASELDRFKREVLVMVAHPYEKHFIYDGYVSPSHKYGHPGFDFHPLGHMAQVGISQNRLFLHNAVQSITPNPFLIQVTRHAGSVHDLDEAEFPGILLHHGSVIGDIGVERGKSDSDRLKGRAILRHVIKATFHDVYTEEFSDAVIALASHDYAAFDKPMRTYHAVSEMNHELNTLTTAHYLGKKALEIQETHPLPSFLMTALASDSVVRGIKKRNRLKEEGLTPELTLVLTEKLRLLYWVLADRDQDESYAAWRNRSLASERFGEFTPANQFVVQSLDSE